MPAGAHATTEPAPVGLLLLDGDRQVAFANARAEALFAGEELNGRPLAELLGPEAATLADRLAPGGDAGNATVQRGERLLEVTLARTPEGGVLALVAGQGRAASELQQTRSMLDTVVQTTSDAVFVKDRAGRYLLINQAGAETFGLTPQGVVGRTDSEFLPPQAAADIRSHDLEVMGNGEPMTLEEILEVPAGRRTFLSAKAPYRDGGGAVTGLIGISRDITERKRDEEEQRLLAETSELIESSLDPAETVQRLAILTVSHFGELCVIDLVAEDGTIGGLAVAATREEAARDLRAVRERWPIGPESAHPVARVLRSGRAEIVPELPDSVLVEIAQSDEHLALMRRLQYSAAIVVPLRARGKTLGTISVLHMGTGQSYGAEDMALVEQMAERAATALDNARLYEHQQSAAETLQRSLLPRELPQVEGLEVAVRYEPGGPDVEIGGDWYDLVPASDGSVVFVIGDVAGRGLHAATIMGQLRNALRAYALDGERPAQALNRLDRFAELVDRIVMATVTYARLEPASGRLSYASAGHPPPLLVGDIGARFLEGATRGPVGIGLPPEDVEHVAQLDEISTLLLYTDGLVERRGEDLAAGLDRLRRRSEEAPRDAQGLCDHLVATLVGKRSADDTALLALRRV